MIFVFKISHSSILVVTFNSLGSVSSNSFSEILFDQDLKVFSWDNYKSFFSSRILSRLQREHCNTNLLAPNVNLTIQTELNFKTDKGLQIHISKAYKTISQKSPEKERSSFLVKEHTLTITPIKLSAREEEIDAVIPEEFFFMFYYQKKSLTVESR